MNDIETPTENQKPPVPELHGKVSSYKARIRSLKTDIRIPVIPENEVVALSHNQPFSECVAAYEMSVVVGNLSENVSEQLTEDLQGVDEHTVFVEGDEELDDEAGRDFTDDDFRALAYMSILDTLMSAIPKFESVIEALSVMEPVAAALAVREIYEAFVRVNPKVDPRYHSVLMASETLEANLERAMPMLPVANVSPLWLESPVNSSSSEVILRSLAFDEALTEAVTAEAPIEAPVVMTEVQELAIEPEKVLGLEASLKAAVIGQELAIEHVASVARRMAVGFRDESRPAAVFMFAGPTGVGKTLMAKEIAKQLFGDGKVGRIDCSMLSDSHHSNKLFGAPPGYIGFPDTRKKGAAEADPSLIYTETRGMENGGVLLLDEVEKAHPDIWDGFLTIFDEGYAKTSAGNIVDFRNMIIVMTTNLGSRTFAADKSRSPLGFMNAQETELLPIDMIRSTAMKELEQYMKPEVIGRITEVVPFRELIEEELVQIVDLEWAKTSGFITRRSKAAIELGDELKYKIATKSAGRGYGARLVSRLLDLFVVDPLAEFYLSGGRASFDDPDGRIFVSMSLDDKRVMVCSDPENACHYDVKESSLVA